MRVKGTGRRAQGFGSPPGRGQGWVKRCSGFRVLTVKIKLCIVHI